MFTNDSSDEDASLTELYAEVLGPEKTDDALTEFDTGEFTFSVEFVDFDHGRFFNVASLPLSSDWPDLLSEEVALDVADQGDIYIVFETNAESPEQAIDELSEIASLAGASTDDITTKKRRRIETGPINRAAGWIMDKLGMSPPEA
ncbi:hypothetical protein G9464_20865 [Halostella sp. JP-L12]|uniref:hypothetical protein n=1 Tax=Halostella TaxID=1843185 RepID=UPI000EF78E06|nr:MULTISPECIES: hypothetical protein [Halostella]NHN50024.1 hypothetical protein [Halostella sp. JP-L12]